MRIARTFSALVASTTTAASLMLASPASAQTGPITVDIRNVASNIAQSLSVDAGQLPRSVQVPPNVAAGVCGIPLEVLARMETGGVCTALSTSAALNKVVQDQVKS